MNTEEKLVKLLTNSGEKFEPGYYMIEIFDSGKGGKVKKIAFDPDELNENAEDLQSKIDELQEKINDLEFDNNDKDDTISDLEDDIDRLNNKIEELENTIEAKERAIEQLKDLMHEVNLATGVYED